MQPIDGSEAAVLSLVPAGCSRAEVALEPNAQEEVSSFDDQVKLERWAG